MHRMKETPWKDLLKETFHATLPLSLSYIPVGLACGILLHAVGFPAWLTVLFSVLVFSGGAQFLTASMLAVQAPLLSIITMTFFLELRYALLSSSLSTHMKSTSKRFIALFTQSLNDENYGINYLKFSTDSTWNSRKALFVNWFSMLAWTLSNLVGTLIGEQIKIDEHIVHFALTAMFLYMLTMQVKNSLLLLTGIFSGALAVGLMLLFQNTFGLILATLLASLAGFMVERWVKKKEVGFFLLRDFGAKKHAKLADEPIQVPLSPMIEKEVTNPHE